MAQSKGWLCSTGSFRVPRPFSFVALASVLFLSAWSKLDSSYFSIASGKKKVWRSTYPASVLRPRPGSSMYHFLSSSIWENIVIWPYPAAREARHLVTMLLLRLSVDQITKGPICHPELGKGLHKLLFSHQENLYFSDLPDKSCILQPPHQLLNLNSKS